MPCPAAPAFARLRSIRLGRGIEMSLRDIFLDQISEQDVNTLKSTGVPESPLIDYKRDTYGTADGDKREFLADISSFANTMGGDIVIGIDESNGLSTEIRPITGDVDAEIRVSKA
jgi:hypothetical protein